MLQRKYLLSAGTVLAVAGASVFASRPATLPAVNEFEEVSLTLQVNATDEDIAVMISMEAAEAFLGLVVHDPFGEVMLDVRADDPSGTGLSEMLAEANRDNIAAGLAAFPEGTYGLTAIAVDGTIFHGRAVLSHDLPSRPHLMVPDGQTVAAGDDLTLTWQGVLGIDHYVVEVEGPGLMMSVELPADVTSFDVPAPLLRAGAEYQVGVGAANALGNVVIEEADVTVK